MPAVSIFVPGGVFILIATVSINGSSMSRKGNSLDNVAAKSCFGNMKKKWMFFPEHKTRESGLESIFDYVEMFYSGNRRYSSWEM